MEKYTVFDAHCDTLCSLADFGGTINKNEYNTDLERMCKYKSYTQAFACFIAPDYYNEPKARFEKLYNCYKMQNFSGITPMLTLEGGEAIDSLEYVDYLKNCNVRCVALTWNYANQLAGGVADPEKGLTDLGKSVVRKMNEKGIYADVSHLNDKSFYDVVKVATLPVIATHSDSRAVCGHNRNLTDDMFKIIKECNGCVGINLYPLFINGEDECSIDEIIKHIEHFAELGGIDNIGIGADFDGTDNSLPDKIKGSQHLYRLFDRLKAVGFDDESIEKISHKNFERIFGEGKNA